MLLLCCDMKEWLKVEGGCPLSVLQLLQKEDIVTWADLLALQDSDFHYLFSLSNEFTISMQNTFLRLRELLWPRVCTTERFEDWLVKISGKKYVGSMRTWKDLFCARREDLESFGLTIGVKNKLLKERDALILQSLTDLSSAERTKKKRSVSVEEVKKVVSSRHTGRNRSHTTDGGASLEDTQKGRKKPQLAIDLSVLGFSKASSKRSGKSTAANPTNSPRSPPRVQDSCKTPRSPRTPRSVRSPRSPNPFKKSRSLSSMLSHGVRQSKRGSSSSAHAPVPQLYATVCRDFATTGYCPREEKCPFAHQQTTMGTVLESSTNENSQACFPEQCAMSSGDATKVESPHKPSVLDVEFTQDDKISCRDFATTGSCSRGRACPFQHVTIHP